MSTRLVHLGHASWLVEVGKLRILFDPLLAPTYHDGLFEVFPRRRIDPAEVPANIVIVTHRHPDHFDVPTLHALAREDPNRVLLTADPFVARTATALGFRWVKVLADEETLDLGDLTLTTTPSHCAVVEWGVMMCTEDGVLWNQVDTELGADPPAVVRAALDRLGRDELDLGLLRWAPLLQSNMATGAPIRFPAHAWTKELDRAASLQARAIVPAACGNRFVGPSAWLNQVVYPASDARFLRELHDRGCDATPFTMCAGDALTLQRGTLRKHEGPPWIHRLPSTDDRTFTATVRPLFDPSDRADAQLHETVARWVADTLTPVTRRRDEVLQLDVVGPRSTRTHLLHGPGEPTHHLEVAASVLVDVIAGRSPWGRAVLGGFLRCRTGFTSTSGHHPLFVYDALAYEESFERWIDGQLTELGTTLTP